MSKGEWTHAQCEACWIEAQGDWVPDPYDAEVFLLSQVRAPSCIVEPGLERCCFCLKPTIMGIFVREDPAKTLCGETEEDMIQSRA